MFSWAELGLSYFIAVILWVVIAPVSINWLSPLWFLSLAVLPFTLWSLLTQAFFIRKWCLFCCAIVVLLWVNASFIYLFIPFNSVFPIVESLLLSLLLLTSAVTVIYISKTGKFSDTYSDKREAARFKYDFKTITCHLSESRYETGNVGFVWGNQLPSYEIVLILSIACPHCGKALNEFRRLIEIYPDFCFRLIFAVNTDDFEHKSNIITYHLINLYKSLNKDEFFDMLDAWYTTLNKNLEALQKKYPVVSFQYDKKEIEALYQFSQQFKIGYTPAILLDSRLLSQLYSYRDLFGIVRTLNAET